MSGFGDEYQYGGKYNPRSWRKILLPVMGFILIACAGAISFALSLPATQFVRSKIQGLPEDEIGIQVVVGFSIFLVIVTVFAVLYAMLAPKPPKMVSESALDKEKKEREKERRAQKKRNRQVRIDMMKENQERDKRG